MQELVRVHILQASFLAVCPLIERQEAQRDGITSNPMHLQTRHRSEDRVQGHVAMQIWQTTRIENMDAMEMPRVRRAHKPRKPGHNCATKRVARCRDTSGRMAMKLMEQRCVGFCCSTVQRLEALPDCYARISAKVLHI